MKFAAAIVFAALCGFAYGAVYQEGQKPGGEHDGTSKEVEEAHPLPNEDDTLHDGLKHVGHGGQVRGAAPLVTSDPNVQKSIVDIHNALRRRIPTTSTYKMNWDPAAQKVAQQWAEKCEFRHPTSDPERATFLKAGKLGCGQNIAMGTGAMTWNQTISDMWHGEIKSFKYGEQPTGVVGHYTAIVWKNSHKVGCGYKMCPAKNGQSAFNFFVCDYCPAGNVSPNQYKPYDAGVACGKCKANCEQGLCTRPCEFQNEYSNCEASEGSWPALFPNGCTPSTDASKMESHCGATCNCKGKSPY